ncbi:MAG TPA: hypothetical protein V6D43_08745 [Candidatus Sericytochromatia bacterium]
MSSSVGTLIINYSQSALRSLLIKGIAEEYYSFMGVACLPLAKQVKPPDR